MKLEGNKNLVVGYHNGGAIFPVHKSFDIVCFAVSGKSLLTKSDNDDSTESVTEKINPKN